MSDEIDLEEWIIRSWEDGWGEELRLTEDVYGVLSIEGRFRGSAAELLRVLVEIIQEVMRHADL